MSFFKTPRYKSKDVTDSAKGKACALRLSDNCADDDTVVFCHFSFIGGSMGGKPSDIHGAYGCSRCHDIIDGRAPMTESIYRRCGGFDVYLDQQRARAKEETLNILLRDGLLAMKNQTT